MKLRKSMPLVPPAKLGLCGSLKPACGFTFLLVAAPVEMLLAFIAAGVGDIVRF
ncbi:MAG: hypothetical protein ACLRR3_06485 [Eubacterium sp.]